MAVFPRKKYVSSSASNGFAAKYRAALAKRPFLLFGLPFMSIIVAGSFVLTPATAIRYERHDRKVRQMTREEELGVGKSGRRVDLKDEYYVSEVGAGVFRLFRFDDFGLSGEARRAPADRLNMFHSDLRRKISIIGSRNVSNDCRARATACYNTIATTALERRGYPSCSDKSRQTNSDSYQLCKTTGCRGFCPMPWECRRWRRRTIRGFLNSPPSDAAPPRETYVD